MRRWAILCIIITMLTSATRGVAQSRYTLVETPRKSMEMGVWLGAAALYMDQESAFGVDCSPKVGVRAALMMALVWQEKYALQIEMAYLHNKIEASRGAVNYDVKTNVMEVPIMFSYRGLGPMRFNIGPVLSLAASGRYSNGMERIEFGRMRPTMGYTAGVGVELTRHLVAEARLTGGLADTDHYFEGIEFSASSYWATLGISYVF